MEGVNADRREQQHSQTREEERKPAVSAAYESLSSHNFSLL